MLDTKKVLKAFSAQNPGASPRLMKETCSDLNSVLSGLIDEKFGVKTFCDSKVAILQWMLGIAKNPQAPQKMIRKVLNDSIFAPTLFSSLISQLQAIGANPEAAYSAEGFESEKEYVTAKFRFSPEIQALYETDQLTIGMILVMNPNLLLSNS